jgi:antitoxin component HigA of HigAB toxin-antitoxin module
MEVINNENDYQEVMKRIDELIYETNEDTPIDDLRLQELDRLATLVESYEKQVYNFSCDSL